MKRVINKSAIILGILVFAISLCFGLTMAWFTSSASASGTITTGHLRITDLQDSDNQTFSWTSDNVVPGTQIANGTYKALIDTNINYFVRLLFRATVVPSGNSHVTGCKDNFANDTDILSISIGGDKYQKSSIDTSDGYSAYYKLAPSPSSNTAETFDLDIKVGESVGDGGCTYYMGAAIQLSMVVEVVQANYWAGSEVATAFTDAETMHATWEGNFDGVRYNLEMPINQVATNNSWADGDMNVGTFDDEVVTISTNAPAIYKSGSTTRSMRAQALNKTAEVNENKFNITFTQRQARSLDINLNDDKPFLTQDECVFDKGVSITKPVILKNVGNLPLKYRLSLSDVALPFMTASIADGDVVTNGSLDEITVEGILAKDESKTLNVTITMTDTATGLDTGLVEFTTTVVAVEYNEKFENDEFNKDSVSNVPVLRWFNDTASITNAIIVNMYSENSPAWCLLDRSNESTATRSTVTMSVPQGYKITNVKITYSSLGKSVIKDSTYNAIFSGQSYRYGKSEVQFTIHSSLDGGNYGQVYIKSIQVEYIKTA